MGANKVAESANISKFKIYSNKGGFADIRRLVTEFTYEESVFDTSIRVQAVIIDSAAVPSGATITSVLDMLRITGGELVELEFQDNLGGSYTLEMYVDELIATSNNTKNQVYLITMVSKELLMNESKRVRRKYEFRISDNVIKILREVLQTPKTIIIDPTINEFNFLGVNYKPFYWCLSLAKKSIPFQKGLIAGYLFFENYKGYNFRSIDLLFGQGPKRKYVYNETVDGGSGTKILQYNMSGSMQFQRNLSAGTYSNQRYDFEPRKQNYDENLFDYEDQEGAVIFPASVWIPEHLNQEFLEKPSRYFTYMKDVGALPPGKTLDVQLEKSAEENLEIREIAVQAAMRYQQAFQIQMEITIAMDLGVNVGDIVFVDIPEISSRKQRNPQGESQNGGLYMVSEICHKLTQTRSLSKLILVRDSLVK
tara:strand:- start:190 stop:1458 length:1269 start_codon:yes stop_codon:yes gene_type:complete